MNITRKVVRKILSTYSGKGLRFVPRMAAFFALKMANAIAIGTIKRPHMPRTKTESVGEQKW